MTLNQFLDRYIAGYPGENKIEPLCIQRGNPQETNAHADSGDQSLAASISTNTD